METALATIPGFFGVGGGPGEGHPFGVYEPAMIPAAAASQGTKRVLFRFTRAAAAGPVAEDGDDSASSANAMSLAD